MAAQQGGREMGHNRRRPNRQVFMLRHDRYARLHTVAGVRSQFVARTQEQCMHTHVHVVQ